MEQHSMQEASFPAGSINLKANSLDNGRNTADPSTLAISPQSRHDGAAAAVLGKKSAPVSQGGRASGPLDRDQILDAAWQCLRERGYDAMTIRRIAGMLDCAIGSIYRYYRDKHDLLCCVTQRPYEAIAKAAEEGRPFAQTARDYVQRAMAEPQSYFLMFWLANQKLQASSQAQAGFELPPVIQRIIAGWARQTSQSQAIERWSMLHGSMTAGADALAILNHMTQLDPPHHEQRPVDPMPIATGQDTSDDHDKTAAQIVTLMRTSPKPRKAQDVADVAQALPLDEEDAVEEFVSQKEDVCLL